MQELGNIAKDLYDELGTYQISFLLNERTREINYPNNTSKEIKKNLEILEQLEIYIHSLKKNGQTSELINRCLLFARFLFELHEQINLGTLQNQTRTRIIEFLALLLNLLNALHYHEEFMEIATMLFEQKLETILGYSPKQKRNEIDQGILGLMRNQYFKTFNFERAKELKRMRNN